MPTTSSRLGLDITQSTDAVSGFPTADAQAKAILDNAAVYKEGTLASRTNPSYDGQFYKTTDSGAESLSWFDGSVWLPLGLIPAIKTASGSVVSGQAIITSGSSAVTITLPAHAAGQMVAVKNGSTGGTTVSGSSIQGLGLSSASSFPLGAVGSSAVLIDDGTNWHFLAGQQDTGWVSLGAMPTGWAALTQPSYRVLGDRVWLSGSAHYSTGGSNQLSLSGFPHPPFLQLLNITATITPASPTTFGATVDTSGNFLAQPAATNGYIGFDGVSYRLV